MSPPGLDREAAADLARQPDIVRLFGALAGEGDETRIVGGAVRNALLGLPVREIDLATTAVPKETMRRAKAAGLRSMPTGAAHGTVTVLVEGTPFEVTTLREDVETDGRHAVVRFGRNFEADALRRDFTINALSVDAGGRLHDTVGGLADLVAQRVRFIGEARQRIREDFLRVLRFFRFSAEYAAGPLDPAGLDAAIRERDGLDRLSRERVRAELLKLLVARRAVEIVAILAEAGLLGRLTGGVAEGGRLARAAAFDAGCADPILRLAALLVRTDEDADRLREGLRLSNAEHERLAVFAAIVSRLRSRAGPLDRAEARRLAFLFGAGPASETLAVLDGEPRPLVGEDGRAQLRRFVSGDEPPPAFPLTGADLVREGVPAGPEIGRRLAEARREWLAAGCPPAR